MEGKIASQRPSAPASRCTSFIMAFDLQVIDTDTETSILWPFEGDQPINASRLADTLQVGYELIEVRTGLGLQPMLRSGRSPVGTLDAVKAEARDILTRAFGDHGARLRENLGPLRRALLGEWEEGGASRRDVVGFLNSL